MSPLGSRKASLVNSGTQLSTMDQGLGRNWTSVPDVPTASDSEAPSADERLQNRFISARFVLSLYRTENLKLCRP